MEYNIELLIFVTAYTEDLISLDESEVVADVSQSEKSNHYGATVTSLLDDFGDHAKYRVINQV